MSLSRPLLLLVLGAAFLASAARAATPPPATQPAAGEDETVLETQPVAVNDETTRDVDYWTERSAAAPDDVTVRLALGNAYALNKRYNEAVAEYRLALKVYPDYKQAWNNLGSAYRALGRKEKALSAYSRAIKIDPRYALVYYNLGVVYDSAGRYEKALEYYGEAVKYDPTLLDPKKNPQVVRNRRVFAVLLHNYVESAGSLALPLEPAYPPQPEK